jgi:hypothetical protein
MSRILKILLMCHSQSTGLEIKEEDDWKEKARETGQG